MTARSWIAAVMRRVGLRPPTDAAQVEEEMRALLRERMQTGSIVREEQQMVERVFQLGARPVRSVMTPRVDVEWLDATLPFDELKEIAARTTRHRLPVAAGRIDDIKGIAIAKDLCTGAIHTTADLTATIRPPLFIPETASALELLAKFRESRNHMAVVLNEFGEVEGIVTPTDMLEALVGALPSKGDEGQPLAIDLGNGSWSVDAAIDLPDIENLLGIAPLPDQKSGYQTLAGYLIGRLGHLPREGEYAVIDHYRFEVQDMDGRRINRILVRKDSSLP